MGGLQVGIVFVLGVLVVVIVQCIDLWVDVVVQVGEWLVVYFLQVWLVFVFVDVVIVVEDEIEWFFGDVLLCGVVVFFVVLVIGYYEVYVIYCCCGCWQCVCIIYCVGVVVYGEVVLVGLFGCQFVQFYVYCVVEFGMCYC